MPEILPRNYIIGIVMFTFFIVAGMSMLGIFAGYDATFASEEKYTKFNESFNVLNDVSNEVEGLEDTITEADTDFGFFGVLNSLISSSWQALKLLFTSLSFMTNVYGGLTAIFGVPAWIPIIIGLVVTVIITFSIFSAIFQRDL